MYYKLLEKEKYHYKLQLTDGETQNCTLCDVLFIPKLAYNLLSVSKAPEADKTFHFSDSGCEILNSSGKCVAFATKVGSLYYLKFCRSQQQLNVAAESHKERLWHRRYKVTLENKISNY